MPSSLLLLNPPSPANTVANREGTASYGTISAGFAYPPHTLATILARCQQTGIEAACIDAVGEGITLEAVLARVHRDLADLIAVYTAWGTLDADRAAIAALREALPHHTIIACGAGSRHSADELLVAGASHVLLGDPELALPFLAEKGMPQPGIVRVRDILPSAHNHAGLIRDPELGLYPAWDQIPWQHYGFPTVLGARGCDDTCRYCAYVTVQGRAYRPRLAPAVVSEMKWLQETYRPRRIMLRDIVFARDRRRATSIAQGLIAAGFHTPWECESRPEHFDSELLRLLARSGCNVIKIGLESADPATLARIGRIDHDHEASHYLAYTRQVIADARRFGIATRVFVLVGLPQQTPLDITTTAAYLREAEPTFVHVRPYISYPRVPLGPGLTDSQIMTLAAPLEVVAAERQQAASRPPSITKRIRRRLQNMGSR